MAIYAIGDIQGCYDELRRLLDLIQFDPAADQLWLVGDLVNRGPASLATLRFVKSLDTAAVSVLGNHDCHLLAAAYSPIAPKIKPALRQVLEAADCHELLEWLRRRPFIHAQDGFYLIHGGLPPQWDATQSLAAAQKAETVFRTDALTDFLRTMYGNTPDLWNETLSGFDEIRFIVNCFTRMRFCDSNGRLDFEHSCPPGQQPAHLMPWFKHPQRLSRPLQIIFGHWSSLGYYQGDNCFGIDTGCLWGGQLTALKIGNTVQRYSLKCAGYQKPGD